MKKNRIKHSESLNGSIERIPFLAQFAIYDDNMNPVSFSSVRINEYMEYELVKFRTCITSDDINKLLEEAEKRGDI
jgi:hypothetical protein